MRREYMKARIYRTCGKNEERLKNLGEFSFVKEPFSEDTAMMRKIDVVHKVINIHPEVEFDKFEGFGGAFTEATAVNWASMTDELKEEVLRSYFSAEEGIGYTVGRVSIGSSDFSVDDYTYVEEGDETLESFDLSREERAVIPMIQDAKKWAEKLQILASPWSPPKYMKDNKSFQGGHLLPEYYGLWSLYLRKFVDEMKKRGIDIWALTVQNETRHQQLWESCCYTAKQEMELVKYLGPALEGTDTKIYVYDHNKERLFERCKEYYSDPEVRKYVEGIACHWYTRDHFGEIALCRKVYPDKKVIMSEGCIYHKEQGYGESQWTLSERYAHDIIGNLNEGVSHIIDWNMVLDEENGPFHWREGRNHCDAGIFYNKKNKELYYHPYYFIVGQFSKFIRPGAVRIGHSCYSPLLEATAFKNPDGSLAVVVYNQSDEELPYIFRMNGEILERMAQPHAVETIII